MNRLSFGAAWVTALGVVVGCGESGTGDRSEIVTEDTSESQGAGGNGGGSVPSPMPTDGSSSQGSSSTESATDSAEPTPAGSDSSNDATDGSEQTDGDSMDPEPGSAGAGGADGSTSDEAGAAGMGGQVGLGAAGAGGEPSAGGESSGTGDMRTHVPDVPVTYVGEGPDAGLSVTHSHVVVASTGLIEWFAVIEGSGPDPVCFVGLNAEFLDAGGNVLLTSLTTTQAPMYESFGGPSQCVGAGDKAISYGNGFSSSGFDVSLIAEIRYGIAGNIDPDAVPRDWISVESVEIVEDSVGLQIVGTLSGAEDTLTFPNVSIYPMNAAGMPLAEMGDTNLDDIPAGGSWTFQTTYYTDGPIDDYYLFVDYDTPF